MSEAMQTAEDERAAFEAWYSERMSCSWTLYEIALNAYMAGAALASKPVQGGVITEAEIDRIAALTEKAMEDGLRGFMRTWGWQQFARTLIENLAPYGLRAAPQPVQTAEVERAAFEALGIATAALEKLAKLGNGERAGNSIGNLIAQEALSAIAALASKPVPQWFDEPFIADGLQSMGLQAPTPREFGETIARRYAARIKELESALSSAPAQPVREPMWQPIETAPKDGRKFLLTYKNSTGLPRIVVGGWVTDEEAAETDEDGVGLEAGWYERIDNWGDYYQVSITEGEPTHWMPLPAAPGITKE